MADIREQVLARLVVIAGTITDITTVQRNKTDVTDLALPAFILLDGNETSDENDPPKRNPALPRRTLMSPQIGLLASGKPADVGATLNDLRAKVVKAIMQDATLIDLTLDGTGVAYDGCAVDIAAGRQIEGQMTLQFTFTYMMRPDTL